MVSFHICIIYGLEWETKHLRMSSIVYSLIIIIPIMPYPLKSRNLCGNWNFLDLATSWVVTPQFSYEFEYYNLNRVNFTPNQLYLTEYREVLLAKQNRRFLFRHRYEEFSREELFCEELSGEELSATNCLATTTCW